jgi:protease I
MKSVLIGKVGFEIKERGGFPKMSKVAVIISDWFEDSEYTEPAKAFRDAGHDLVNIGLKAGETVEGKRKKAQARVEKAVQDVSVDDFDALLIPGGYSPDRLRVSENAVHFVKDFVESGKPVFAICHAPQILINANVLKGRKLTGWKSLIVDIKNAGAEFVDREVVEDGNLISSRQPKDLPAFIKAALQRLQ